VIIHDVPLEPESYVHRIGRTGRAGLSGHAIMFCDAEEIKYLKQVTKLIGKEIPLVTDHPYHADISQASGKTSSSS
jgi:ATP-dependent RNA helicase RhlE